ncbi:N-chimaerin [Aplysia californica]|uniref:N-chimaerin n=1 Tax=Aplysia californica TaxID=6500 RepID=A0ABM1VWM8_APLCA|nr:N-chimaerin [Aplysia californica]
MMSSKPVFKSPSGSDRGPGARYPPPVMRRRINVTENEMAAKMSPSERKAAVCCLSTDTALDYTQGQRPEDNIKVIPCRRSASLQQHKTIGVGDAHRFGVGDAGRVGQTHAMHCRNRLGGSGGVGGSQLTKLRADSPTPALPGEGSGPSRPVPAARQRSRRPYDYVSIVPDGEDTQCAPTWNTYLYQLQQEAPKPVCIQCQLEVPNRPSQYGKEFHGSLSRQEVDRLLQGGDGCYLVRKSERAPDAFTLAIRFDSETKNFKLYYDGKHYVGDKRFDSIYDLVADGLIHFYIELRAADYIKTMSQESKYEQLYMAYNTKRKRPAKSSSKTEGNLNGVSAEFVCLSVYDIYCMTVCALLYSLSILLPQTGSASQDYEQSGPATDVNDYEKAHIFKLQNFIGLHWCYFCLNFMWGLLAQGVKCQDCGLQAHKKCSEKIPNDCMPDMKYIKRIFGSDLTTVVKVHKSLIPFVVEKCVKEIEARGIDLEGLYRLAGFHDDVEALRLAFDKDAENTDVSCNKYEDINTICSALKLYFRLLPIPLITCEVYKKLMEIIKNEDNSPSDQVRLMKEPISSLPPAHFHTLKYMCQHLARVVDHKQTNKMSFENLAIVFAPTLMRDDDTDPMASLMAAKFEQKVTEVILVNHAKLMGR